MKRSLIFSALSLAMLVACTALNAQTESRTVTLDGSWDAINLAGTQNIHFDIGPEGDPITVVGTPNDLDNLEVYITGGTLTVRFRKGYKTLGRNKVDIYVKNPTLRKAQVSGTGTIDISGRLDSQLNEFSVSGTGRIYVESINAKDASCKVSGTGRIECSDIKTDKLTASVSGAGRVTLSGIKTGSIEARTSGTGRVTVSGETVSAKYSTSGTGGVHAEEMIASGEVTASASGTGSIYCHSDGSFSGRASGTGKVYLTGNPTSVSFSGNSRRLVQR